MGIPLAMIMYFVGLSDGKDVPTVGSGAGFNVGPVDGAALGRTLGQLLGGVELVPVG